jgi:hypothetical protein
MARPTKLTPAVRSTLIRALREGHTITEAAQLIGVGRDTIAYQRRRDASLAREIHEARRVAADALTIAMGSIAWDTARAPIYALWNKSDDAGDTVPVDALRRRLAGLLTRFRAAAP